MKRYFFDWDNHSRSIYDYHGRDFPTPEAAFGHAEIVALDLEVEGEWGGWKVIVRDTIGKQVYLVPVREADSMAA